MSLLDPLTPAQQQLVEVVAEGYMAREGDWPLFGYVEGRLDKKRLDAWSVYTSFNSLPLLGGAYSPLKLPDGNQQDSCRIGLTVIGAHHSATMRSLNPPLPTLYFATLRYLTRRRRQARLVPDEVPRVEVTYEQVRRGLLREGFEPSALAPGRLLDLLAHEPPTWGEAQMSTDESWTRAVSRRVIPFAGTRDISDYAARIMATLTPTPTWAPSQPAPPPLSLAASLDYLDTVWRLVHSREEPLFALQGAESTARLAQSVASGEEFSSQLSALAELLRSAHPPGSFRPARKRRDGRTHPLGALLTYLDDRLSGGAAERATSAVVVFEAAIALRDGGQHPRAATRGARAHAELGLSYPISDWSGAWERLRIAVIDAADALRGELQTAGGR